MPLVCLTISWRRFLSHTNQSIDLLCKSKEWILYDRDLRHVRVKYFVKGTLVSTSIHSFCWKILFYFVCPMAVGCCGGLKLIDLYECVNLVCHVLWNSYGKKIKPEYWNTRFVFCVTLQPSHPFTECHHWMQSKANCL